MTLLTSPAPLRGRLLRYAVVVVLAEEGRTMSLQQIADALDRRGLAVVGAPRKAISDALRAELTRHRVIRVARGHYRGRPLPRSTDWSMRHKVRNGRL